LAVAIAQAVVGPPTLPFEPISIFFYQLQEISQFQEQLKDA
jgi:hypothetical protein